MINAGTVENKRVNVGILSVNKEGSNEYKEDEKDDQKKEDDYILSNEEGFNFFNKAKDEWIDN